jgi:hypothetical protein
VLHSRSAASAAVKSVSQDSIAAPAASAALRWYVLVMMCLVYTLSIADRYVVSTVLEPIRLELHLSDSGIAFLTGVSLALFYVAFGFPISWLTDRKSRRGSVLELARRAVHPRRIPSSRTTSPPRAGRWR